MLRMLLVFAVVLGMAGCRASKEEGSEGSGSADEAPRSSEESGGGTSGSPTLGPTTGRTSEGPVINSAALPSAAVAAELLEIQIASLRTEVPVGNFATLTVLGETGAQVPLSIESVDVEVTIEGHMARTQVTQVFRNHRPQQTEGTYEFTLPDGAAISRLAMDVEGVMMEGELVERERARAIYEQIVRSMRDPALLEWQGGNRFKTQIFPIPANGTKTVILAYETLLPESREGSRYVYSLPQLSGAEDGKTLGRFRFSMTSDHNGELSTEGGYTVKMRNEGGRTHLELEEEAFLPRGPLTVRFAGAQGATRQPLIRFAQRTAATATAAAAQGQVAAPERFFAVDLVPQLPAVVDNQARNLVIAIDTSAGLGQVAVDQARVAALMLISQLPDGTPWRIVHGDYKARTCGDAPMTGVDAAVACLKGLDAGGATDLEALLTTAVDAAASLEGPTAVVLFSDGAASLGQLDGDVIRGRVERAFAARYNLSLHTVAMGHSPSEADLEQLANLGRGHALRMTPVAAPETIAATLAARIQEPVLCDLTVEVVDGTVEGLSPARPRNVARGQGVVVLGRLVSQKATVELKGRYAGEPFSQRIELTPAPGAIAEQSMLASFWARANIEEMHQRGEKQDTIVDFSLNYGVMSPYTSFLVLENEEAYRRFEVERRREAERLAAEQRALDTQQAATGDPADTGVEQKNLTKSDKDLKDVLAKPASPPGTAGDASPVPRAEAAPTMAEENVPSMDAFDGEEEDRAIRRDGAGAREKKKAAPATRHVGQWGGEGKPGGGWHQPWDPEARIKQLEELGDKLSATEIAELAWLLADHRGKPADGQAALEKWFAAHAQLSAGERFGVFAQRPGIIATYASLARPLAAEALTSGPLHEAAAARVVVTAALEAEDVPTAVRAALEVGRPLGAPALAVVLEVLVEQDQVKLAEELFDELHKARGSSIALEILNSPTLPRTFATRRFQILQELVRAEPPRLDLVRDLIAAMPDDPGFKKGTVEIITDICSRGSATLPTCQSWIHELAPADGAEAVIATVREARLKNIDQIRARDIGNPELITEFASALRAQGREEAADRLLSEIVEFTPHAYSTRIKYVAALRPLNRPLEVCREYAVAVQLDPRQRDHFRHMMSLRRDYAQDQLDPQALRECIVQGVSNLPVNRDVSLVLTWDDPTADIDLHIHEVGEHHVYYQKRESPNGGLLYYDITDGYGPEIYVLGNGPKGTYKLSLVYYARGSGKVRGTLTVLENAGSRSETRKDIPFELTGPDNKLEIPIYELSL